MSLTLVTGGSGFIGRRLVARLLDEGRSVRVITRQLLRSDRQGLEFVQADVTDLASVVRSMEGVDRVFHLAGAYDLAMRQPKQAWDTNLLGTLHVCQAAVASSRVRRVVVTGSIAALGVRPGKAIADESEAFNYWDTASDYQKTKYLGDEMARSFADRLDVVLVDPAFPVGPGDDQPTPTGRFMLDLFRGSLPPIVFRGGLNLVDVEDVVDGHLLAESRGKTGRRYLLSGTNIELGELMRQIDAIVGRTALRLPIPAGMAELYGLICERVWDRLGWPTPSVSRVSVAYPRRFPYFDGSRARSELGFCTRPLQDTLRRVHDFYLSKGWLER